MVVFPEHSGSHHEHYGSFQSGIFFGFIPFRVGWEIGFFDARGFFARQREKKLVFFWCFIGVFLCFFFLLFFRALARFFSFFFFGAGMSKTGNSRFGSF